MSSAALCESILSDARAEAEKIISEAEAYREAQKSLAEKNAEEYLSAAKARAESDAQILLSRRKNASELRTQKSILAAKQQIVGKVYQDAYSRLLALKKADYLAFVKKLIATFAQTGDKVIISENCPIDAGELESDEACKKFYLTVEKTGKFDGGIILSGEKFDKDLTFSALVSDARERTEAEIAAKLFG